MSASSTLSMRWAGPVSGGELSGPIGALEMGKLLRSSAKKNGASRYLMSAVARSSASSLAEKRSAALTSAANLLQRTKA